MSAGEPCCLCVSKLKQEEYALMIKVHPQNEVNQGFKKVSHLCLR